MNFADPADEAAARQQLDIEIALANRKAPEPLSAVCRNADCGEPSQPGTSYCCASCREDDERWKWALSQKPAH